MQNIKLEKRDNIAIITISRPKNLNALDTLTLLELKSVVEEFILRKDITCCIITGEGERSFVAGADIGEMHNMSKKQIREYCSGANEVLNMMESSSIIFIAAVNGYAFGGGNELAMACDLRLASRNAVFSQPEINLGIIPGFGGTQRLPRLIGQGVAMEMILTGKRVNAEEALRRGLVNMVVDSDKLLDEAFAVAKSIVSKSPVALESIKRAIYKGSDEALSSAIDMETDLIGDCFETQAQRDLMGKALRR